MTFTDLATVPASLPEEFRLEIPFSCMACVSRSDWNKWRRLEAKIQDFTKRLITMGYGVYVVDDPACACGRMRFVKRRDTSKDNAIDV